MNQSEWADIIRIVKPYIRDVTLDEDAAAHALSLIPEYPKIPSNYRGTPARWMILCAKRAAMRYLVREARRGLTMRNGSRGYSFLELDSPVEVDGDDDSWHSVIPGHHSPELWLEAVEKFEGRPRLAPKRPRVRIPEPPRMAMAEKVVKAALARAAKLTPERRAEIARKAAAARWKNV